MISRSSSVSWGLTALTTLLLLGPLANPQAKSVRFENTQMRTDPERKGTGEDLKKLEDVVQGQFPVLRQQGVPALVSVTDEALAHTFREYRFFALQFRQYPVGQIAPEPLKTHNVFAVPKKGAVQHVTDGKALEKFFQQTLPPVTDAKAAKDSAEAWLRLTEEFTQDGFFKFSIPKDSLTAVRSQAGWQASGKALVTQGGKGEIRMTLTFTEAGKLTKVDETNTVKAGVRPICQATKLLDPDPIVRQMAEKDLLVMGRSAREYLEEQRGKAPPKLKQAIDRVLQRILEEGW